MAFWSGFLSGSGAGRKVAVGAVHLAGLEGQLAAIHRALAVIEFDLQGTILSANENFLRAFDYRLEEVKGQHHSMLVEPAFRVSDEYRRFWQNLGRGESAAGLYKRVGKGGREVWLQASYNSILDDQGKPYKVVKFATDVTAQVSVTQQMQISVAQTQDVAKSAIEGDLSRRVDTSQVTGDALRMSEAINLLLTTVGATFHDVQEVTVRASSGDLSGRVATGNKTGDLRKMAESVNILLESVSDIVSNVKEAANEVLRGAEEISQGNSSLSQRTEEQSASLEETASSMEEMTSTVKQNADNAGQANQLAAAAREHAEKGGAVVSKAVAAMAKINEASTKIADIIGVIDEIAFQTNLLALNAAVEAARAGEQGRGFAVVATEVRSLAGRSATAAKEIKELIQDSVQKVEDGSMLVTHSGQTLDQIVTSVKKVSDIVAEIAAASREQSAGIEQVNKAVMQMDEMTQQNAALVEESTAASQSLADQARQLTKIMDRYGSGDSFERPAAVAPRKADAPAASTSGRRSAARPWSAKAKVPARAPAKASAKGPAAVPEDSPDAAAQPRKTAGANGNDPDWLEF